MSILEMMKGADSGPGINLKMSHVFPLAILLHTAMDFIVGLTSAGVWNLPVWSVEGVLAIFGVGIVTQGVLSHNYT